MEWLLFLLIIAVVVVFLLTAVLKNKPLSYVQRKSFLSAAERSFFGVLSQAVPSGVVVLCKVRVADVLSPVKGASRKNWLIAFNKISAKHFDYVLCRVDTMAVVAVVELDDESHNAKSRKQRNAFLKEACESAGLSLIRFAAKKGYALHKVKAQLQAALEPSAAGPTLRSGAKRQSPFIGGLDG